VVTHSFGGMRVLRMLALLGAALAQLVLLSSPARSQQTISGDDVAYMQHDEFVKAVSTDDKATVEALLSTDAGKKSVNMTDREEGLTALVRQPTHSITPGLY
jgi:cell division protein FtsX